MSVAKYASDPTTRRGSIAAAIDAAWIDALEAQAVELAAVVLEIPPRNAVLRADDDGVRTEQRPQLRRERGQAVRLHAENNHVGLADRVQVAGDLRLHLEIAVRADRREGRAPASRADAGRGRTARRRAPALASRAPM